MTSSCQTEYAYAVLLRLSSIFRFGDFLAIKVLREQFPKLLSSWCKALVLCQQYEAGRSGDSMDALQQWSHCLWDIHLHIPSRLCPVERNTSDFCDWTTVHDYACCEAGAPLHFSDTVLVLWPCRSYNSLRGHKPRELTLLCSPCASQVACVLLQQLVRRLNDQVTVLTTSAMSTTSKGGATLLAS